MSFLVSKAWELASFRQPIHSHTTQYLQLDGQRVLATAWVGPWRVAQGLQQTLLQQPSWPLKAIDDLLTPWGHACPLAPITVLFQCVDSRDHPSLYQITLDAQLDLKYARVMGYRHQIVLVSQAGYLPQAIRPPMGSGESLSAFTFAAMKALTFKDVTGEDILHFSNGRRIVHHPLSTLVERLDFAGRQLLFDSPGGD